VKKLVYFAVEKGLFRSKITFILELDQVCMSF